MSAETIAALERLEGTLRQARRKAESDATQTREAHEKAKRELSRLRALVVDAMTPDTLSDAPLPVGGVESAQIGYGG